MEEVNQIADLSIKLNEIGEKLNKDYFSNPVNQVQNEIRDDLIDFASTFMKNLDSLDAYFVRIIIKERKTSI